MSTTHELPEGIERFTDTYTESVEEAYSHGSLNRVTVTVTWKAGERNVEDDTFVRTDDQVTAEVIYRVSNGTARLYGFYADTTKTGEAFKREMLKSLRVLDHADSVVRERVPDEVTVERLDTTLAEHLDA